MGSEPGRSPPPIHLLSAPHCSIHKDKPQDCKANDLLTKERKVLFMVEFSCIWQREL